MLEPEEILASLPVPARPLAGLRVMLTSGPTRERLDPVRYLSNDSSGKMGQALTEAALARGATVTVISGPVALQYPSAAMVFEVESAREMDAAVQQRLAETDLFIAAAAVADYRPVQSAARKMKKQGDAGLRLELVQNPDILARAAAHPERPFCVGFAAETCDVVQHAREKLLRKNVDLIIANDVGRRDIGFDSSHNEVTLVWTDGERVLPRQTKRRLAEQILDLAVEQYRHRCEPPSAMKTT